MRHFPCDCCGDSRPSGSPTLPEACCMRPRRFIRFSPLRPETHILLRVDQAQCSVAQAEMMIEKIIDDDQGSGRARTVCGARKKRKGKLDGCQPVPSSRRRAASRFSHQVARRAHGASPREPRAGHYIYQHAGRDQGGTEKLRVKITYCCIALSCRSADVNCRLPHSALQSLAAPAGTAVHAHRPDAGSCAQAASDVTRTMP